MHPQSSIPNLVFLCFLTSAARYFRFPWIQIVLCCYFIPCYCSILNPFVPFIVPFWTIHFTTSLDFLRRWSCLYILLLVVDAISLECYIIHIIVIFVPGFLLFLCNIVVLLWLAHMPSLTFQQYHASTFPPIASPLLLSLSIPSLIIYSLLFLDEHFFILQLQDVYIPGGCCLSCGRIPSGSSRWIINWSSCSKEVGSYCILHLSCNLMWMLFFDSAQVVPLWDWDYTCPYLLWP